VIFSVALVLPFVRPSLTVKVTQHVPFQSATGKTIAAVGVDGQFPPAALMGAGASVRCHVNAHRQCVGIAVVGAHYPLSGGIERGVFGLVPSVGTGGRVDQRHGNGRFRYAAAGDGIGKGVGADIAAFGV
jgi:hypothetical protein